MDRRSKVEELSAEIARMEVELELENGVGERQLGSTAAMKMFGFKTADEKHMEQLADEVRYAGMFLDKVLQAVCDVNRVTLGHYPLTDQATIVRFVSKVPARVWGFTKVDNDSKETNYLVLFYVGANATYSIVRDDGVSKFDYAKLGVSELWSKEEMAAKTQNSKQYRFVRAQLHGILLYVVGALPTFDDA